MVQVDFHYCSDAPIRYPTASIPISIISIQNCNFPSMHCSIYSILENEFKNFRPQHLYHQEFSKFLSPSLGRQKHTRSLPPLAFSLSWRLALVQVEHNWDLLLGLHVLVISRACVVCSRLIVVARSFDFGQRLDRNHQGNRRLVFTSLVLALVPVLLLKERLVQLPFLFSVHPELNPF